MRNTIVIEKTDANYGAYVLDLASCTAAQIADTCA